MKNTKGFTLVELIVVIAILAILAGIAIPVYSGYISKAKEAADMQMLDSVRTATVFAVVDANHDAKLTSITYTGSNKSVTVATDPANAISGNSVDISTYVGGESYSFKGSTTSWTWTEANGWKANTAPAPAGGEGGEGSGT